MYFSCPYTSIVSSIVMFNLLWPGKTIWIGNLG